MGLLLVSMPVFAHHSYAVVLVNSGIAFGYSGRSHIGKEPTDEWLARVIRDGPLHAMKVVADRIKERAKFDVYSMRVARKEMRFDFLASGWFRLRNAKDPCPGTVMIDNAIDPQTGTWLAEPRDSLQVRVSFPFAPFFRRRFETASVGESIPAAERSVVTQLIGKCMNCGDSSIDPVIEGLIRSMLWLSRRHPTIGRELMFVTLPKAALRFQQLVGHRMYVDPYREDAPTFCLLSPRGRVVQIAPHVVWGTEDPSIYDDGSP